MANFYSFLKFVKVPDVKLVFRCLDANEGHATKLWNVIAKLSGLVLTVKYVSSKKFLFWWFFFTSEMSEKMQICFF